MLQLMLNGYVYPNTKKRDLWTLMCARICIPHSLVSTLVVALMALGLGCGDTAIAPPSQTKPTKNTEEDKTPGPDKLKPPVRHVDAPAFMGQPCNDHTDCVDEDTDITGYCASTHPSGAKTCTIGCVEECPAGYGCSAVANVGGSDALFLCIPEHDLTCEICSTDSDCVNMDTRCVDIAAEGHSEDLRCAISCATDSDCHEGYQCEASKGGDFVCLPKSRSCSCTGFESTPVEPEPCVISNAHGTCSGIQTCTEKVGWVCDAAVPAVESCDGTDNNCNGTVDEGCPITNAVLQIGSAVIKSQEGQQQTIRITVSPIGPVGRSPSDGSAFGVNWGFYHLIK